MATTLLCPGCGRSVVVEPAAGKKVHCPGCGKSLTFLLQRERLQPAALVALAPAHGDAAETPNQNPEVLKSQGPLPAALAVRAALVLLVACCLIGGGWFVGQSLRQNTAIVPPTSQPADSAWERDHRTQLLALKSEAEAAVLSGDLRGGHQKYQQLSQLAFAHPIHDPLLAQVLHDADVDQERVYQLLLHQLDKPAAATAPVLAAVPPPTPAIAPPPVIAPPPATAPAAPVTPPTAAVISTVPATAPAPLFAGREADRQITVSLSKAVEFLVTRFKNGQIEDGLPEDSVRHQGLDALCAYALLHASQTSNDPRLNIHGAFMAQMVGTLKSFELRGNPSKPMTPLVYARSLRAAALAVYDRPEDHAALRADVAWLVKASMDGAYTYDDRFTAADSAGFVLPTSKTPQGMPVIFDPDRVAHADDPHLLPNSDSDGSTGGQTPAQPAGGGDGDAPAGGGQSIGIGNGLPARPVFIPNPPPPPMVTQPPPKYDPLQTDSTPKLSANGNGIPWDNSNSQYGLLGVWSGAETGIEVPLAYWRAVEKHWTRCQLPTGEWSYSPADQHPTLSMTCGGVASLLVTREYLDPPATGQRVARNPPPTALTAGTRWLETGDHLVNLFNPDLRYLGYTAYGIERCALASGYKYFGTHDWYLELAEQILSYQNTNGAWGRTTDGPEAEIDTAYLVLFLARGQQPILINKLRTDGDWDNRPRDLANLTAFASRELERPFNWQVVNLDRTWQDWLDAPVLYIAGSGALNLNDEAVAKLRAYTEAGGLIFTQADGGSEAFTQSINQLAHRLWPDEPLTPVPAGSDLFSINFHLAKPPQLLWVTNGSRPLLIHSPGDISAAWQDRLFKPRRDLFEFGVNLSVFAGGRSHFRNRLDFAYLPPPAATAVSTISVARLRYAGNWDPEPYAWTRFARYFQNATGIGLLPTTLDLTDLKYGPCHVAVLTGNRPTDFSADQARAAADFVNAGGTLLIDDCGGGANFVHSAEDGLLARAFPGQALSPALPTDPLVSGAKPPLDDLTKPVLRPYLADKLSDAPAVQILHIGRGRVIFSPLDITTGLLDSRTWDIAGYTPSYAQALVKNMLLTMDSVPR